MSGLITFGQNTSDPAPPDSSHSHLYFKSDGLLYKMGSDGVATEVGASGGGGGAQTVITLASDVTNSTVTLANVTGLSFAVTSGTMYRFYAMIAFTSAATSTGSQWTMNGPAKTRGGWLIRNPSAANNAAPPRFDNAYDTGVVSAGATATDNNLAIIEGYVLPSATGTLIVRFASSVGGSAIVAKAGSTITYW